MLKTISSITNALGALNYKGTWNASTNTPTLTSSVGTKGDYYVVSVAGSTNLNGEALWGVGDWAVFNGSVWQRVEGGDTVNATTVTASTSVTTPIVQASNSGGLALKNASGTTQLALGAGGGDNIALNVSTNINGANAQIDISPSGTGHVHIKPAGSGSIEIAPTAAGTINNMSIGATTASTGRFTSVTATTDIKSTGNTDGYSGPVAITSIASGASGTVSQSGGGVTLVSGGISFNNFWDLVIWQYAGNAVTISSAVYGSPSSRTYSVSSGDLVLAITNNNNTGTYSIGVTNIGN